MLSTLGKKFQQTTFLNIFLIFPRKEGLMQVSPMKTICMKCQILFSGKNKKKGKTLSSAEIAKRMVKVNKALQAIQIPSHKTTW